MMESTGPPGPDGSVAQREMPQYECHKKVWALKIRAFDIGIDGGTITPADEGFAPFDVGAEWITRYKPDQGDLGYYVVYDDGDKSWSPTEPFEKGYTLTP